MTCDAVQFGDVSGEPAAYMLRVKELTTDSDSKCIPYLDNYLPDTRRHILENCNLKMEPVLKGWHFVNLA
jgi:hypothetical protein